MNRIGFTVIRHGPRSRNTPTICAIINEKGKKIFSRPGHTHCCDAARRNAKHTIEQNEKQKFSPFTDPALRLSINVNLLIGHHLTLFCFSSLNTLYLRNESTLYPYKQFFHHILAINIIFISQTSHVFVHVVINNICNFINRRENVISPQHLRPCFRLHLQKKAFNQKWVQFNGYDDPKQYKIMKQLKYISNAGFFTYHHIPTYAESI